MSLTDDRVSLAQFKREVKSEDRFLAVEHCRSELVGSIRVITRTQTNGWWFSIEREGEIKEGWMEYPKASGFKSLGAGRFRFDPWGPDKGGWTLELLP
jgi:hypothetical protein